jgi:SAM-dependent methyltransferase
MDVREHADRKRSKRTLAGRQIELLEIAEGYFSSQVLFSANELGIFEHLAEHPRSLADMSRTLGAGEDPLERLLNAGVAVALLTHANGMYQNSELASAVLVPGRPGYLGNWIRLMSRWMRAWVHLSESVMTGKPAEDPSLHLGRDPEYTRDFVFGMDDYARVRGSEIIRYLEFGGGIHLLDAGGGPGSYAILFARHWPDLRVTIFDLPDVIRLGATQVREAGLEERILLAPGDYYKDELGTDFDAVFLSDTLHQESPEACEMLLRKAYRALKPGGKLVVQAMFLNEDRVSPRWPVMHSLILLLVYGGGRAYTVGETISMIESAGFVNCVHRRMSLLNVNSLILADKEGPGATGHAPTPAVEANR